MFHTQCLQYLVPTLLSANSNALAKMNLYKPVQTRRTKLVLIFTHNSGKYLLTDTHQTEKLCVL